MKFFILLDTSGSMEGAKIGALNDAMSNILVTLQGAAFDGKQIELSVMTFGKTAQWMYDSPNNPNGKAASKDAAQHAKHWMSH